MNYIGKILTLLIMLMSVCFLVTAVMVGAAHRNWKAEAKLYKEQAEQSKIVAAEAKSKTGAKDQLLNSERTARAFQLAQLESQLKIAKDNYDQRETQLSAELAISQERLRRLEQTEARLAIQDAEVASLKAANSKLAADIAAKFALVQNLTNEKSELQNQRDSIQNMNEDLSADLAQKTKVMKSVGVDNDSLVDHIAPKIDGAVTRVVDAGNLIAIALGSDDGLRVGHEMDVYRNDRYIGKVRISKTDFNDSVAQVIKDFMQDRVQEGDHVTTKF